MNQSKAGQAGIPQEDEIEVTPRMIRAGDLLLMGWEDGHPGMLSGDEMAEAVFRAMLKESDGVYRTR